MNKAYSETYAILQSLPIAFLSKIPTNIIEFLKAEKDNTYNVNINPSIALEKQELLPETIGLLAMLKLDYWCNDEKEKKELLEVFNQNEEEYQISLRIQYNPDNLFKKRSASYIKENTVRHQLIEYKESILKKILKKFLKLF